jgi:acyl carrier protein
MEGTIDASLKELIIRNSIVGITSEDIKEDTDLINDLGFDSIRILRLFIEIRDMFGIEIEDQYLSMEILGKYQNLRDAIKARILLADSV